MRTKATPNFSSRSQENRHEGAGHPGTAQLSCQAPGPPNDQAARHSDSEEAGQLGQLGGQTVKQLKN